jgi:hypothetical protein
MPFPVSVRGEFVVIRSAGHSDIRAFVIAQAENLLSTRSDNVTVTGQSVISRPGLLAWWFTGPNWHSMAPFDQVKLIVSGTAAEAVVAYELSTRRMFRIVGLMSLFIFIFVEATSFERDGPVAALSFAMKAAAGAFVWLFGMNFLIGLVRGPRWLRAHLSG